MATLSEDFAIGNIVVSDASRSVLDNVARTLLRIIPRVHRIPVGCRFGGLVPRFPVGWGETRTERADAQVVKLAGLRIL